MSTTEVTPPAPRRFRRLRRSLWVLFVLVLVARFTQVLWLEPLAARLARGVGLELAWSDLDLTLWKGFVELRGLDVELAAGTDAEGQVLPMSPLLTADYFAVDVDMGALLHGDLVLTRVGLGHALVEVERDATGHFLVERLLPPASPEAEPALEEQPEAAPERVALPFALERLDLAALELHFVDAGLTLDQRLTLGLEFRDLGLADAPGKFAAELVAPGWIGALRLDGHTESEGDGLALEFDAQLLDLSPDTTCRLVSAFGVEGLQPLAHEVDARLHLRALVAPTDDASGAGLRWTAALDGVELSADGVPALKLAELGVELRGAELGLVTATGLELTLARGVEDDLRVAGFGLTLTPAEVEVVSAAAGATAGAVEGAVDAVVMAAEEELDPIEPSVAEALRFGPLEVRDLHVFWADHSASLASSVELELGVTSLTTGVIELGADVPVSLELELFAPGIFTSATLSGSATLGAEDHLELELEVLGLAPLALEPYLAAAGIESRLSSGSLVGSASARRYGAPGERHLDATLSQLALGDGSKLLGLDEVALRGLELESGGLVLDVLDVVGPAAALVRHPDGAIEVAGLVFLPSNGTAASPTPAVAESAPPAAPAPARTARVSIGRFVVRDVHLNLRDETVSPVLAVLPERLDLVVENLALGDPAAPPATLQLDLVQAGLAESLAVRASLAALGGGGHALEATVVGRGLATDLVAPYLVAVGVEGALVEGALDLSLRAQMRPLGPGATSLGLTVEDVGFAAGDATLLGLGELSASLVSNPEGLSVSKVLVSAPELFVERRADGLWSLGGLTWVGPPETAAVVTPVPLVETAGPPAGAPANPVQLGGLVLEGGLLHVRDQAVDGAPSFDLALHADVGRIDLVPRFDGTAPPSTPIELVLEAPGLLEELALTAELIADPAQPSLTGSLRLTGIHGPSLAPYLTPDLGLELDQGNMGFSFLVAAEADAAGRKGEWAAQAELLDLSLTDGPDELLHVARFGLEAPRLSREALHVAELSLEGAVLDARRDRVGVLHVAGVALGLSVDATPAEPVPAVEPAPSGAATTLEKPLRPLLNLDVLHLELARFGYVDEGRPEATPLSLALLFENTQPWEADLMGDEEASEPLHLRLSGSVAPVLDSLELDLHLSPFLSEPHFELGLALDGLSGSGLAAALPGLTETLDASAMEGGSFTAQLYGGLAVTRRGPFGLDLARGISGDLELTDVAFRLTPEAPVELGLQALTIEVNKANASGIELGTVELNDPIGRVELRPEGLVIAGLVLVTPPPPVAVAEAEGAPPIAAPESPVAAEAPPVAAPAFDVSVAELFASGLDFVFRDETSDPPVVLPLNDLDLSVNGLTTRALREPVPVRFELFVGAGNTALPERVEAANVLTGLFSAAASVVTGGSDDFKTQQRPAFGGLDASGRVTLFPSPQGWVSLSIAGLELPVFRGAARKGGVDLGDGLLNLDVGVRLLGERGAAITAKTRVAYLSLSEPPGGPISSYLKLPAPLDTVLYLLRDESGDVVLPLNLTVDAKGGIKGLGTEISKTLGLILGEAIASSPLRIVGGVLDMTGLMRDEQVTLPEQPARVLFLPGSSELALPAKQVLAETFRLMRRDSSLKLDLVHGFGASDLAVLGTRANPSPEACRALALRLSVERDLLISLREERTTDLRARFAAGDNEGLDAGREELLELDGELARSEEALDSLLALLRPGAERRALRRTRVAAMLLAEARLETVRAFVAAQPIESIGARLRVRRARFSEPDTETQGGSVFVVPR